MQKNVSLFFMLATLLFGICLVTSNLLVTKMITFCGINATAGILLFPITYILNDCIAEVWGYRKIRLVIWLGFGANLLVVVFTQLAILCPAPDFWTSSEAFQTIFNMAPRIFIGSAVSFLAGSFLNAYVMSKMKIASQGKNFSVRAVTSTLVAEVADSAIFFPIAFYGLIPTPALLLMVFTQAGLKTLYEIVVLPLTIVLVRYIKKVDGSDAYDTNTSYNILKIKEF